MSIHPQALGPTSFQSKASLIFGLETMLMLGAIARAILLDRNPMRYFDEGGIITWLSILQLLWLAYLCWAIAKLRHQTQTDELRRSSTQPLWRLMAGGFVFLALDEYLGIHEEIEVAILQLLDLSQVGAWRRIDDFVILFYVLTGLLFLRAFRRERSLLLAAARWFWLGFGLCFLTVALDMLSHSSASLVPFLQAPEQLRDFHVWFKVCEEIPKIFAEGAFILAFYRCLAIAQQDYLTSQASRSASEAHLIRR